MSNESSWTRGVQERNRSRSWLLRLPILIWLALEVRTYLRDPYHAPLWDGMNLAFHEIGHVVFLPFPEFLTVLGGTLLQILIPLVAGWILIRQKDDFGGAVALFWLGTNLMGIAVYVGDARSQALPLVSPFPGEIVHDWNYILGTLGLLESDARIARLVRTLGYTSLLTSVLVGGWMLLVMGTDPVRRRNRTRRRDPGHGWARAGTRADARDAAVEAKGSRTSQTRVGQSPDTPAERRAPPASPEQKGRSTPHLPPSLAEEDRSFSRWWAQQTGSVERPSPSATPSDEETEFPLLPDDLVRRSLREIPETPDETSADENESTPARSASIELLEERARRGELSPTELRFLHWLRRQR